MSDNNTIRWDQDADGIVTLTLDDPTQRANTMNAAYQAVHARGRRRGSTPRRTRSPG